MKKIAAKIGLALWALSAPMAVQAQPVVIELFTSQGCSSCPPADELLGKLKDRRDIIALAQHVDYWDYIGWKDIFADPDNTLRQRAYARHNARRMIYTPQMIIAGDKNIEGAKPMQTLDAVRDARRSAQDVDVRLKRDGDRLSIRVKNMKLEQPVDVQIVRYAPEQTVSIKRGENRGRTITYHNIVTSWDVLRTWDGTSPLNVTAKVSGDDAIAVILQYPGPGTIVAAAKIDG